MKKLKKHFNGFTLVELIIVITIIAILSTIAFVSFQNFTKDSRDAVRLSDIKTIYGGLQMYKIKANNFPNPDDFTDIVGVSNQGYAGESIGRIIKINKNPKDPLNETYYTYSTSKDNKKIQLSAYLEKGDIIQLSQINLLQQAYGDEGIDYTNRILYTYGDKIGMMIDETTKQPVQEIYLTGTLDLNSNTGTYIVQFSNTSTNSGSISGSGTSLLTQINLIQNSCLLGTTVVNNGNSVVAYSTQTVAFGETCAQTTRTCNNGVLDGDNAYEYDTCSPVEGATCTNNGVTFNHEETKPFFSAEIAISCNAIKKDYTCFNGTIKDGENIATDTNTYKFENCVDDTTCNFSGDFDFNETCYFGA